MNLRQLKTKFNAFHKKAGELINDKGKTLSKIEEGLKIASEKKKTLTNVWHQLLLFFSLTKDYVKGNYVDIPKSSIVSVLAALLYFISPLDLVPDFIAGMGFLDDAFILGFIYNRISKEIDKYETWKKTEAEKKQHTIKIVS